MIGTLDKNFAYPAAAACQLEEWLKAYQQERAKKVDEAARRIRAYEEAAARQLYKRLEACRYELTAAQYELTAAQYVSDPSQYQERRKKLLENNAVATELRVRAERLIRICVARIFSANSQDMVAVVNSMQSFLATIQNKPYAGPIKYNCETARVDLNASAISLVRQNYWVKHSNLDLFETLI